MEDLKDLSRRPVFGAVERRARRMGCEGGNKDTQPPLPLLTGAGGGKAEL